jgi:acyl carrier protein
MLRKKTSNQRQPLLMILAELVLAVEEAFEIDIPDEDTEKIRSVQDAVSYIEAHTPN